MSETLVFIVLSIVACFSFYRKFSFLIPITLIILFTTPGVYAADLESLLADADQHYRADNHVKALPLYEEALGIFNGPDEEKARLLFKLGKCYHFNHDRQKAIDSFRTVNQSYPTSKYTNLSKKWLGDCYALQNKWDTAIQIYTEIINDNKDTSTVELAQYEIGVTCFNMKEYSLALEAFLAFVDRFPGSKHESQARFYIRRLRRLK